MSRPVYHMYVDRSVDGFPVRAETVADTDPHRSQAFQVPESGRVGFDLESTGTLTGTWTLWYSNDDAPDLTTDTDWEEDTAWAPTNPAGAAIKNNYAITDLKVKRWRVKFVASGGSGTVSGRVHA